MDVYKAETDLHFDVVLIFLNGPAQSIADKHFSIGAAGLILSLLKLGLQALHINVGISYCLATGFSTVHAVGIAGTDLCCAVHICHFLDSLAHRIADKHAGIGAAGLILSLQKLSLQALHMHNIGVNYHDSLSTILLHSLSTSAWRWSKLCCSCLVMGVSELEDNQVTTSESAQCPIAVPCFVTEASAHADLDPGVELILQDSFDHGARNKYIDIHSAAITILASCNSYCNSSKSRCGTQSVLSPAVQLSKAIPPLILPANMHGCHVGRSHWHELPQQLPLLVQKWVDIMWFVNTLL